MSYADELNKISRTPITLMVMTLDLCGRVFGVSPCLATGEPCYNTYPTCKYKTAYLKQTKDYKFTSANASLPFKTGERPYIKSVQYLPTEIKDNLTVSSRVQIELHDEPDTDIGIDPYVSQRSSIQGTFFKKLIARNLNYKGRYVKLYEGFSGLAEAEYQQRFIGIIDNITLSRGFIKIEVKDILKKLSDIEVPLKLNLKLAAAMSDTQTTVTLNSVSGLDSPSGYIRIDDEIMYYTGISGVVLTGCSRGYFSTTASSHSANTKVQKTRYYAPQNPFDLLKEILQTDGGIDVSYIDTTQFDYWRDYPDLEPNFSAIISEPVKLDKLYFELIDILDCKSWVAEDLKITIRRNMPNKPGRGYTELSDSSNIIHNSGSVDLNQKSQITKASVMWNMKTIGKIDEFNNFERIDVAIDVDAEGENEYNESLEKKFFVRWFSTRYLQEETAMQYAKNFSSRQVYRQRDAQPIISFELELKDSDMKTGDYIKLTTDEILEKQGNNLNKAIFQVIKRDFKGHKITLSALRILPRRFGFIGENTLPDWDSANDNDKEYGFVTDNLGKMPDLVTGYAIW